MFSDRKSIGSLVAAAYLSCLMILPQSSSAQYGAVNHAVTVTVSPITVILLTSAAVNLTFSGAEAIAGVDQMTLTDQTCQVQWGTNSTLKKVTVQSNVAVPVYSLKLVALSPTQGLATPEFSISGISTDLLLNIGRSSGSAALRYTATVLASQGTGIDAHTITFTIQNQ